MPFTPKYRKRRTNSSINKNDLKISRNEAEKRNRASAGTLRENFPDVREVRLELRMESPQGAVLNQSNQTLGLDEPLYLDVSCEGGCSGGKFKLTDAVQEVLTTRQETRQGMGLCQGSSYQDPNLPCNVKFYYRVVVTY